MWGFENHRSPPVLNLGTLFITFVNPGVKRGEQSAPHDQHLATSDERPALGPCVRTFLTLMCMRGEQSAYRCATHWMAGRDAHYAQRCLLIGDIWEVTRSLSNLLFCSPRKSGTTLRRVLLHPPHLKGKESTMRLILPNYLRC